MPIMPIMPLGPSVLVAKESNGIKSYDLIIIIIWAHGPFVTQRSWKLFLARQHGGGGRRAPTL